MQLLKMTSVLLVAGLAASPTVARAQSPPAPAAPATGASAAAPDDEAATALKENHRHHHHGGVTRFISMSLDTLGADEAKRPQIEKLKADLQTQLAPARDAEKELLETIATGVAGGSVDKAKVDAAIAKVAAASEAAHAASLATLNSLHAILSPTERQALVDKVQAHWEVWREVNHDAQPGGKEKGGRLATFASHFGLTPDQVGKMSSALQTAMAGASTQFDPKAAEAHVKAFATAFAADSFDAKTVTANANGHIAGQGATRMAVFYETVTPLLTPDQRTKLAEHLREHSGHESAPA
jgi:Spy/CpxP family protein refolding chaperone